MAVYVDAIWLNGMHRNIRVTQKSKHMFVQYLYQLSREMGCCIMCQELTFAVALRLCCREVHQGVLHELHHIV